MNRDLTLVGISLMVWGIGEGMFAVFQPLYLQQLGASPLEIGGILGIVGVAVAIFQAPAGYLTDRFGPRPLMWASWLIGTLATLIMAFAGSLQIFMAGMILYGITMCVVPAMNTYNILMRGRLSTERALTITSAMYNIGAVSGPFLGGFIGDRQGLQFVYRFSAGLFVLSTILIFLIRPARTASHAMAARTQPAQRLLLNRSYAMFLLIALLVFFSAYLPQPLTPNYLQNVQKVSLAGIGQVAAIGNLSNVLVMLALGGMAARSGLLAGLIMLGAYAFLLWRGTGAAWFGLAYGFLGGYRMVRLMTVAFLRRMVPPAQIGIANGFLESVNGLAMLLAPALAGVLFQTNPGSIYLVSLVLLGVSALASLWGLPLLNAQRGELDLLETPLEG